MLITLAYRIPRDRVEAVLGSITAYRLTKDFSEAWEDLPRPGGRRPRHSALAIGLTAVTGEPVKFFGAFDLSEKEIADGATGLLLTSAGALDHRLRIGTRTWEKHVRDGRGDARLVDHLPEAVPRRPFETFVGYRAGLSPTAPNWVFRTAAWQVMRTLTRKPLRLEGRSLRLRMDTSGNALAWDTKDLLALTGTSACSMAKISVRLVTRKGMEDLVLAFDAHLSRISTGWWGAKHTWIDGGTDEARPVLRLRVKRRRTEDDPKVWESYLDPAITKIFQACELTPLRLPSDEELAGGLHGVRPQASSRRRHPVGSGVGPRFMRFLHDHITREIPDLVPLEYLPDKEIKLPKAVHHRPTDGLAAEGVWATGHQRVTIVCLYGTASARTRMLTQLRQFAERPTSLEPSMSRLVINDRLDVVLRHCPDLIAHSTVNRAAVLADLDLPDGDGRLLAAWIETEYHPNAEAPDRDAKPHLRRLFAHRGVPTQFLATDPPGLSAAPLRKSKVLEYAAEQALRDLLRAAGVLDRRLLDALTTKRRSHPLDRTALLVGVHARRQHSIGEDAPLVLVMSALYVDPDDLSAWRIMYYDAVTDVWAPGGSGAAAVHAAPIGDDTLGRTQDKAARTRDEVERRLSRLASAWDAPLIVFTDAPAVRTVWPGLQNGAAPGAALPGDRLVEEGREVAVVRVLTDMAEIGRPVDREEAANQPDDDSQPAAPGAKVYRLAGTEQPSWLLAGTSRTYSASFGRTGVQHTRWTLPDDEWRDRELGRDWHSFTAREIIPVRCGSWSATALAALTARLCDQSISWDGRTLVPAPLQLAISLDRDHPDHRSSGDRADGA